VIICNFLYETPLAQMNELIIYRFLHDNSLLINDIRNTFAGYFKIEISIFTLHVSTKLFFKEYGE